MYYNKSKTCFISFIVVFLGIIGFVCFFTSCNKNKNYDISGNKDNTIITEKGENMKELIIEDLVVGTGAEAMEGQRVSVHYTGTLTNGTKFDSSLDRKTPFSFVLGRGDVISGWDEGVKGMKVGGKRKLTIPPDKAYGNRTVGPIPANSILVFEVELLATK